MKRVTHLRLAGKHMAGLVFLLFLGVPLPAQQADDKPRNVREEPARSGRPADPSDLGQQNQGRVAASAVQIRGVLVKDEGLLVELKRWVAKEATDSGQVVDDSNLTDQAIFERLEQDVVFRSVATRLLQRYGYLMPTSNPDSDLAKEKELVLKERARRLVQIESQEDTEALRPQGSERDLERTATCDPRREEDCPQLQTTERRQRTRSQGGISSPQANPQSIPEQFPQQRSPRVIQADDLRQTPDLTDGASSPAGLELTSSPP